MAYSVIRTDSMSGTHVPADLVSVKYFVGTTATDIENGNVVKLDGLITDERDVFKAVAPAAGDSLDSVVLIANPEVMYDERKRNLDEYITEAGNIARAYRFRTGNIFSVTAEGINNAKAASADLSVGDIIELQDGVKLQAVSTLTASSTRVGKIIAIESDGRYTYYVIMIG